MAANADAFKLLVESYSKTKSISPKWRLRKPEKADFNLENKNVNEVCNKKRQFENQKQKRLREISASMPSTKVSVPLGWEGYTMLIIMCFTLGHYFFSETPNELLIYILAGLTLLVAGFYMRRKIKVKRARIEIKEKLEAERAELYASYFDDEGIYDSILAYAEAVFDHEAWQQRRKPSYWKEASPRDAGDALNSIYAMLGYYTDESEEENIAFTMTDPDDDYVAISVAGSKHVTAKHIENLLDDMNFSGIEYAILYAFGSVDAQAEKKCERFGIEIKNIDDVLELVAETEKLPEDQVLQFEEIDDQNEDIKKTIADAKKLSV